MKLTSYWLTSYSQLNCSGDRDKSTNNMFVNASQTTSTTPAFASSSTLVKPNSDESDNGSIFTILLVSLWGSVIVLFLIGIHVKLRKSGYYTRFDGGRCACVEATKEQPLELPEVCDVEIVPEHELWINLSNDFEVQEPQPAEVCAV